MISDSPRMFEEGKPNIITQLNDEDFLKEADSENRVFYCKYWDDKRHNMQLNY